MEPKPGVTAVIVNYNARAYLELTLESLARQDDVDLQVVVVDNASDDGSVEMVRSRYPTVELVASSDNLGLAGGCNRGIALARHDHVCVMNMDIEFEPHALQRMAAHLDANSGVGAVGPRLHNPDGSLQPSGRRLPSLGRALRDRYGLWRLRAGDRFMEAGRDYEGAQAVGEVPAACIMVPARTLARVGGLDQANFFIYYEDADWCARIAAAGLQVHYLGTARAIHHWGTSTFGENANRLARQGMLRYFRVHQGPLVAHLLRLLLLPADLGAVLRWQLRNAGGAAAERAGRARAVLRLTWSAGALAVFEPITAWPGGGNS